MRSINFFYWIKLNDYEYKTYDKIQQIGCLVLWGLFIWLWAAFGMWYFFMIMLILHIIEILGKKHEILIKEGKQPTEAIILVLILGYTSWLPIIKKKKSSQK